MDEWEPPSLFYRVFGYWIRKEACRLAARAFRESDSEHFSPRMWSMTVFFERYLLHGADATEEDFGPKDPVMLRSLEKGEA